MAPAARGSSGDLPGPGSLVGTPRRHAWVHRRALSSATTHKGGVLSGADTAPPCLPTGYPYRRSSGNVARVVATVSAVDCFFTHSSSRRRGTRPADIRVGLPPTVWLGSS